MKHTNRTVRRSAWLLGGTTAAAAALLLGQAASADNGPEDLLGDTAQVDAAGEQVETNDLGDVVKDPGEEAQLVDADTGTVVFDIAVDQVRVLPDCPGRTDETITPENGHFVVFDVTAAMASSTSDLADNGDQDVFMPLLAEAFQVLDADGEVAGGGTAASWLCFEPDELLQAFVGPGEDASGLVVLDSAVEHGAIRYAPDNQVGWTWEF